jgi:hypothetical protein
MDDVMPTKQIQTRVHRVKTYPDNFRMMQSGQKPFDVREDDRMYERGDTIIFDEWDPDTGNFTGKHLTKEITCKQIWGGLSPGFCALGLKDEQE